MFFTSIWPNIDSLFSVASRWTSFFIARSFSLLIFAHFLVWEIDFVLAQINCFYLIFFLVSFKEGKIEPNQPDKYRRCTCRGYPVCSAFRRERGRRVGQWATCWRPDRKENRTAYFYPSTESNCIIYPVQNVLFLFLNKWHHLILLDFQSNIPGKVCCCNSGIAATGSPPFPDKAKNTFFFFFFFFSISNWAPNFKFHFFFFFFKYLHVTNLVADTSFVNAAASDRVHASSSLISGTTVASPRTRSPFGPCGPLRL